jgi:hypothetical protein
VGAGPADPDTGDGDGLGVTDADDVADADGVAERDWLGERLGRGRCDSLGDGLGERTGLGADGVGLGTVAGVPAGWVAAAGTGVGRTRKYSASTPRKTAVSTMVEVRGRLITRHPRSRARCRGRRRR